MYLSLVQHSHVSFQSTSGFFTTSCLPIWHEEWLRIRKQFCCSSWLRNCFSFFCNLAASATLLLIKSSMKILEWLRHQINLSQIALPATSCKAAPKYTSTFFIPHCRAAACSSKCTNLLRTFLIRTFLTIENKTYNFGATCHRCTKVNGTFTIFSRNLSSLFISGCWTATASTTTVPCPFPSPVGHILWITSYLTLVQSSHVLFNLIQVCRKTNLIN